MQPCYGPLYLPLCDLKVFSDRDFVYEKVQLELVGRVFQQCYLQARKKFVRSAIALSIWSRIAG